MSYVVALFLGVFVWAIPQVNGQGNSEVDPMFVVIDNANYDSLLNSYYIKKSVKNVGGHYLREATMRDMGFDNIPDSILAWRLRALPTIIPMTYNHDVRAYIKMYVNKMRTRIDVTLALSEYYFPMFEEVLNRYGVPDELKYLTIVESAMNPQATSRVGAAGLWQFMYKTGKNYDLQLNSLVDERRDPMRSTVAAARYLRDLHGIFGDWTLAIAAYNCGPGNINKAIARSGGKRDFWQIYNYLPRETRGYIPAYIAATYIMNYYHEHGIKPSNIALPINADTVALKQDMLLSVVERFTGIELAELKALNPQYRTDLVPGSSGRCAITLPVVRIQTFIAYEDSIYKVSKDTIDKKSMYQVAQQETERLVHKVKKGETINKVASRYGVTVSDIKRWNKKRSSTLQIGERLVIYRRNPNYVPPKKPVENVPATDSTSKVSVGESDSIISMSGDREAVISSVSNSGRVAESRPATQERVVHTVKKGETLSSISRKYGIPVSDIKKRNNLRSDNLQIGQKLTISHSK